MSDTEPGPDTLAAAPLWTEWYGGEAIPLAVLPCLASPSLDLPGADG